MIKPYLQPKMTLLLHFRNTKLQKRDLKGPGLYIEVHIKFSKIKRYFLHIFILTSKTIFPTFNLEVHIKFSKIKRYFLHIFILTSKTIFPTFNLEGPNAKLRSIFMIYM